MSHHHSPPTPFRFHPPSAPCHFPLSKLNHSEHRQSLQSAISLCLSRSLLNIVIRAGFLFDSPSFSCPRALTLPPLLWHYFRNQMVNYTFEVYVFHLFHTFLILSFTCRLPIPPGNGRRYIPCIRKRACVWTRAVFSTPVPIAVGRITNDLFCISNEIDCKSLIAFYFRIGYPMPAYARAHELCPAPIGPAPLSLSPLSSSHSSLQAWEERGGSPCASIAIGRLSTASKLSKEISSWRADWKRFHSIRWKLNCKWSHIWMIDPYNWVHESRQLTPDSGGRRSDICGFIYVAFEENK